MAVIVPAQFRAIPLGSLTPGQVVRARQYRDLLENNHWLWSRHGHYVDGIVFDMEADGAWETTNTSYGTFGGTANPALHTFEPVWVGQRITTDNPDLRYTLVTQAYLRECDLEIRYFTIADDGTETLRSTQVLTHNVGTTSAWKALVVTIPKTMMDAGPMVLKFRAKMPSGGSLCRVYQIHIHESTSFVSSDESGAHLPFIEGRTRGTPWQPQYMEASLSGSSSLDVEMELWAPQEMEASFQGSSSLVVGLQHAKALEAAFQGSSSFDIELQRIKSLEATFDGASEAQGSFDKVLTLEATFDGSSSLISDMEVVPPVSSSVGQIFVARRETTTSFGVSYQDTDKTWFNENGVITGLASTANMNIYSGGRGVSVNGVGRMVFGFVRSSHGQLALSNGTDYSDFTVEAITTALGDRSSIYEHVTLWDRDGETVHRFWVHTNSTPNKIMHRSRASSGTWGTITTLLTQPSDTASWGTQIHCFQDEDSKFHILYMYRDTAATKQEIRYLTNHSGSWVNYKLPGLGFPNYGGGIGAQLKGTDLYVVTKENVAQKLYVSHIDLSATLSYDDTDWTTVASGDIVSTSNVEFLDLNVDSTGLLHIGLRNGSPLVYLTLDFATETWGTVETVSSTFGASGLSLMLDEDDAVHIITPEARHYYKSGSSWTFATIGSGGMNDAVMWFEP
jgi:hypothetical protein